jgi:hypothetical protein
VNPQKCQEADGRPSPLPYVPDEALAPGPPHGGYITRRADFACRAARTSKRSDLSLLGDLQGIVHLDAKVANCRLKFAVTE